MSSRAVFAVTAGLAIVGALEGRAYAEGRAVAIVVEGDERGAVASELAARIDAPDHVESPHALRAALAAHGARTLGPAASSPAKASQLVTRAHAAANEVHVDLALLVSINKTKHGPSIHAWVIDAHADGAALNKTIAFPSGASASEEADAIWAAAGDVLAAPKTAPSKPAAPPSKEVASKGQTPKGEKGGNKTGASAVSGEGREASAGADEGAAAMPQSRLGGGTRAGALAVVEANIGAGTRQFHYVDRYTASLRSYNLAAGPVGILMAEVYPLARSGISVVQDTGVVGSYSRAVGLSSTDASGAQVSTTWQTYDFGLRQRFNLSAQVQVALDLGYGAQDFTFGQPTFAAAILPSAEYRYLRFGADARANFGAFSIFGGGDYFGVMSTGPMGTIFPHETVGGIGAKLGGAYMVANQAELSLGIGYSHFYYSFKPQVGDAQVAGGAADDMAVLSLGFAYLL